MKLTEYQIYFSNGQSETIHAGNMQAAIILAQAEQIKKGNSYVVTKVMEHINEFRAVLVM